MDALEFFRERRRMCVSFGNVCSSCPANTEGYCIAFDEDEEAVPIVEKWSIEHPRKTRQSEFLKQFPYAECFNGIVIICPKVIDTHFSCPAGSNFNCSACKYGFWLQEVE